MLAAIPLFGSRVSPRCLFSETMMIVQVEEGELVTKYEHSILDFSEDDLLDELVELGVDTIICGGVTREFIDDAELCGIRVINNVAGELDTILEALKEGRLTSGFGLKKDANSKPYYTVNKEGKRGGLL